MTKVKQIIDDSCTLNNVSIERYSKSMTHDKKVEWKFRLEHKSQKTIEVAISFSGATFLRRDIKPLDTYFDFADNDCNQLDALITLTKTANDIFLAINDLEAAKADFKATLSEDDTTRKQAIESIKETHSEVVSKSQASTIIEQWTNEAKASSRRGSVNYKALVEISNTGEQHNVDIYVTKSTKGAISFRIRDLTEKLSGVKSYNTAKISKSSLIERLVGYWILNQAPEVAA